MLASLWKETKEVLWLTAMVGGLSLFSVVIAAAAFAVGGS